MEDVSNYINTVRRDFANKPLNETDILQNPIEQLAKWVEEAIDAQILDPYAMTISTVDREHRPSSRVVYLREILPTGMVFFTNYNSQKSRELDENPFIAVNFLWIEVDRQVRITGQVERVPVDQSDAYWNSRPRESQIGGWASDQSSPMADRAELEKRLNEIEIQYKDLPIPRPPHWGGFIIKPTRFEFWQGRPSRLHDRIVMVKNETDDSWSIERLFP